MPILLIVDIAFFLATVTKILKGAWVPLLIGLLITYVMWVWRKGQKSLELAVREQVITWADVESNIATGTIAIIPGTGIYLSTTVTKVPQALAAQLKNLHSCPANILIVTVIQGDVPVMSANPMLKIESLLSHHMVP